MTTEDKLKEYILNNFKSIRSFVSTTDLPYTTVDGILKRGIENSSLGNILKICKALNINADELANGRIVPIVQNRTAERLSLYAEKFAQLDKARQEDVMQYIDFLTRKDNEK